MKPRSIILLLCVCALAGCSTAVRTTHDKTTFQSSQPWRPSIDVCADAAIVYGHGGQVPLEERVASWKDHGYEVEFMTGIAWGGYQDYFTGEWDGRTHLDEGQVKASGDTIWHGQMVPYIIPSRNYLEYFKEKVIRRVIDAGVTSIFLEEPEYWCEAGYGEAFKKEWEEYYGTPWRPQHESPEATYLSSKLKYHLYYRALEEVTGFAKEYGRSKGLDVKCYVPTHSLINYTQWRIVSPEASIASIPSIDGYIAQVWTGTARVPNRYEGVIRERTFETAFLEYGCMRSMTAPTGRRVWFLTDPIEDRARDWEDFSDNYHATFTAQLMYPDIADYEVMPWPARIYERPYPRSSTDATLVGIPSEYAAMVQIMTGALRDMPATRDLIPGDPGISVLMANSLMFQRFPANNGDIVEFMDDFFGLVMPLLKRGIPVGITHIENLSTPRAFDGVKVLMMTYADMKPLDPASHSYLAEWVRGGGLLLYAGRDDDPFQGVSEWWNSGECHFKAPSDHLLGLLGLPEAAPEGLYSVGKGKVLIMRKNPREYVTSSGAGEGLIEAVVRLNGALPEPKNYLRLSRGPYEIIAVLDESVSAEPYHLQGLYIDLYDPSLPVVKDRYISPGKQGFFYDITRAGKAPRVLAGASRAYDERKRGRAFTFIARGPEGMPGDCRVLLPSKPVSVTVGGVESQASYSWDEDSSTCLIRLKNAAEGVQVMMNW